MTFGLAHPGYHLPKGQAGKLNFFAPWNGNYNPFKIKMKIKSSDLSKQIENQLHSDWNPRRFLRLQDLPCDWSKHTFQEYFQCSWFSEVECKVSLPLCLLSFAFTPPPFFRFSLPPFLLLGIYWASFWWEKCLCENPRIPLRNRAY